jgi:uncharacterized membrane protein
MTGGRRERRQENAAMATQYATDGTGPLQAPSILTRVTQIALTLNSTAAAIAAIGFVIGSVPHAAEYPLLARRVAAGELAGAFVFVFVAMRLRRNPSLIVLPIAFVLFNLVDSIYEYVASSNPNDLPPMIVEAVFLSIYSVYAIRHVRARRASTPA